MSRQSEIQETLNLNDSDSQLITGQLGSLELKEVQNLTCSEYIDDLLPSGVSSVESSDAEESEEEENETGAESNDETCSETDISQYGSDPLEALMSSLELDDKDGDRKERGEECVEEGLNDKISNISVSKTAMASSRDTLQIYDKQQIPFTKGRPSSCIFVASLAASYTDDELCLSVTKKFETFGKLNGVKVLRDPQNRPYAFVQYSNDQDAQRALNLSQGTTLNNRVVRCEQARVNRTLFISCANPISCIDIENFCERFGELEQLTPSLSSTPNKKDDRRKQILPNFKFIDTGSYKTSSWFVQFAYRDDAIRAYANIKTELSWNVQWVQNVKVPKKYNLLSSLQKSLKNHYDSKNSSAGTDVPNEHDENTKISIDRKSIFVGQLHKDTTTETLTSHFECYGKIFNLKLIHRPASIFAFIEYDDESSAAMALEKENHSTFLGKTIHVQYKEINNSYNYVRRESRLSHYGNDNSNRYNNDKFESKNDDNFNNFYCGPQPALAPPPINVSRHKNTQRNSVNLPPNSYLNSTSLSRSSSTSSPRNYPNYRRHSFPMSWTSAPNGMNIGPMNSMMSVRNYEDNLPEDIDGGDSGSSENEQIDTSLEDIQNRSTENLTNESNSKLESAGLIDGPTSSTMTSYHETSKGNESPGILNHNSNPGYPSNKKVRYQGRRFSYPVAPYYYAPNQPPNYYMGPISYSGAPPSINQPYMMYYPPLPMADTLPQTPYYQPSQFSPHGPNMVPMMLPHQQMPSHLPPPPPPPTNLTTSAEHHSTLPFNPTNLSCSSQSSRSNSIEEEMEEENIVIKNDLTNKNSNYTTDTPEKFGKLRDSIHNPEWKYIAPNKRYQNSLKNKVSSFKPGVKFDNEPSYIFKKEVEELDY